MKLEFKVDNLQFILCYDCISIPGNKKTINCVFQQFFMFDEMKLKIRMYFTDACIQEFRYPPARRCYQCVWPISFPNSVDSRTYSTTPHPEYYKRHSTILLNFFPSVSVTELQ